MKIKVTTAVIAALCSFQSYASTQTPPNSIATIQQNTLQNWIRSPVVKNLNKVAAASLEYCRNLYVYGPDFRTQDSYCVIDFRGERTTIDYNYYARAGGNTAFEKEENIRTQIAASEILTKELIGDVPAALISLKASLIRALAKAESIGITAQGRAAFELEIAKIDKLLLKVNIALILINGGTQIALHAYNDEIAEALSEAAVVMVALGIVAAGSSSLTVALTSVVALAAIEYTLDKILNEMAGIYNTAMYEGQRRGEGGWSFGNCRVEKMTFNCRPF